MHIINTTIAYIFTVCVCVECSGNPSQGSAVSHILISSIDPDPIHRAQFNTADHNTVDHNTADCEY